MLQQSARGINYIVVSPVKDEEKYIETTITAVLRQTIRPSRWIIVDDGSQDKTPMIADHYSERFPWITVLKLNGRGGRNLGIAEIRAFAAGYRLVREAAFDFVLKLDCDLDFPRNYFEQLIARF